MPGIAWKCEAILVVTELVNGKIWLWLKIMLIQNGCLEEVQISLNIYFHIHICAHLEELWWSSKTYMHDVYWYDISKHKPNLYNIICIYISLSLSLWTKPMRLCIIHMIDLLFVCINQKHLQEILFRAFPGPRERSKREGLERFELRIGLGSPRITERADWSWMDLRFNGYNHPCHFFGVTPRNGIVIDLLIEKYGLPGPRLGLVFVRFLSLSHGGKWFERSDSPQLAVGWMDRHRHSRCEVWWLWVCPQISPNSR